MVLFIMLLKLISCNDLVMIYWLAVKTMRKSTIRRLCQLLLHFRGRVVCIGACHGPVRACVAWSSGMPVGHAVFYTRSGACFFYIINIIKELRNAYIRI